jgi:hypothetical protein
VALTVSRLAEVPQDLRYGGAILLAVASYAAASYVTQAPLWQRVTAMGLLVVASVVPVLVEESQPPVTVVPVPLVEPLPAQPPAVLLDNTSVPFYTFPPRAPGKRPPVPAFPPPVEEDRHPMVGDLPGSP